MMNRPDGPAPWPLLYAAVFAAFRLCCPRCAACGRWAGGCCPFCCSAAALDTRFGTAAALRAQLQEMTGETPLTTLQQVEPLGPKGMAQALIIAPATGTTMAMLAAGLSATPVTLAAKSLLRGGRPVVLAPSTNDALSAAPRLCPAAAAAELLLCALRPGRQLQKPCSLKSDFTLIPDTLESALRGVQLQPILL